MKTRIFTAVFLVGPLALGTVAHAQQTEPAMPQSQATDQMKQLGGQLLMSLYERIVQGKPTSIAPVDDPAAAAETTPVPADATADPSADTEPQAAEPEPAPAGPFIKQGKHSTATMRKRSK